MKRVRHGTKWPLQPRDRGGTMSSGDWIALGAALFAAGSCVVAIVAYRLQRRTQASSDEQQLNELIQKMQDGLAELNPGRSVTLQAFAANSVSLTSLRGQALEARKVIDRAGIKPDWFQNMILALAFSQTWDLASANPYWDGAVTAASATGNHPAHISSLAARAQFYYNRGLNDDWDLARTDFETALHELRADPDGQGPDLAAEQVATMLLRQAGFELDAQGERGAVPLVAEAFAVANSIAARWRQRNVLKALGNLVLELQQTMGFPSLLRDVADELSRQEGGLHAFPDETAAVLSAAQLPVPADGSLFSGGDQPAAEHDPQS